MRIILSIIIIAVSAMLTSCEKDLKPDPVSFNVTTTENDYQAGDTVNFSFSGNPDMIMFYSGEPGSVYDFKGRTSADGMSQMQFTSYVQAGTQTGSLALLVSADFDGTYSGTGISAATWTDITSQATLSTGDNNTPSGIIDLSSFVNDDKPVYFAFKYTGKTGSVQNTWTIKNFGINLVMPDGSTFATANMTTAGWKAVNVKNPSKAWAISASQLQIAGGDENAEDNEDWLITAPLVLNKVNPDRGVPIKDISILLDEFSYIYSTPGKYKAVFEAFNAAGTTQKSAQREIEITIR
mgnify:CR=1 FL=1